MTLELLLFTLTLALIDVASSIAVTPVLAEVGA
jgi:hypothetical protein